jgi:hypothetical protein
MGLQRKRLPDASDGRLAHVALLGQASRRSMRRVAGRRFKCHRQHAFHLGIGNLSRYTRTRLVEQSVQSARDKSGAPFADRLFGHMDLTGDGGRGLASRAPQYQSRTQRDACAVVGRRAQRSSVSRSSVVSTIGVTGRPSRIGVSSL